MICDGAIETPRLIIRAFKLVEAAKLVAMFEDPLVARFVGDGQALSFEDADLWVSRSNKNLEHYGYGTGAVVERSSNQLVGWAGFARPDDGPEQLIYGLAAARWREGFGGEIVRALIEFADARAMNRLFATVDPANSVSIRLLERHGFRLIERMHLGEPDSDLYQRDRMGADFASE